MSNRDHLIADKTVIKMHSAMWLMQDAMAAGSTQQAMGTLVVNHNKAVTKHTLLLIVFVCLKGILQFEFCNYIPAC